MLIVGGLEDSSDVAVTRADVAVTSGRAAEVFDNMVRGLGGPADFVDNYDKRGYTSRC